MKRWEYTFVKVSRYSDEGIDLLNQMGQDGWEVCAGVTTHRNSVRVAESFIYLKRELPPKEQPTT